ncbi:hypothetical protein [Arthrobacter sp. CAL618]|uniref:hypothetical protein n=1 Tax=Arthrobacter sp. CAL618 TaxID=1055770 RepID=UPI0012EB0F55|nr:hypothetical protein [Arthrobacter sp. CAL618]
MSTANTSVRIQLGSLLTVVGGLLMVTLWLIFTTLHGATSFNEDGSALGLSTLFWGMLLGSIPNLLIATGLILRSSCLALTTGRLARLGYVLLLIGLIVPAMADLAIQALGPPFFVPVAAVGLIVLGSGVQSDPQISKPSRYLLLFVGLVLGIAFAWALIPTALTDSISGYRIYGGFAHFAAGVGWVMFGVSVLRARFTTIEAPSRRL